MIFVTVGTDSPFDRMLRVIDTWARDSGRRDIFAQVGERGWEPESIEFTHFLEPAAFSARLEAASLVVSHAGMGTILSVLPLGKPILVMPKRASLGEHRNEHQLATARRMQELGYVNVAYDEGELREKLDHLDQLAPPQRIGVDANARLVAGLRSFIFGGTVSAGAPRRR